MSRPPIDVSPPEPATTAGDNAAKRQAKALARQRKAAQRQAALDQVGDRSRPRTHAPPSADVLVVAPPRDPHPRTGDLVVEPPEVEQAPETEGLVVEPPEAEQAPQTAGLVVEPPEVEPAPRTEDLVVEPPEAEQAPDTEDLVVTPPEVEQDLATEDQLIDDFLFGRSDQAGGVRAESEPDEPPPARRARRRPRAALRLVVGLVVLAGGGTSAWQSFVADSAVVSLETAGPDSKNEVLVLDAGTIDLAGVASQAERLGRPEALQRLEADTYLLTMPTTVAPGGHLVLEGTELRLLSEPGNFVGLEARGGALTLQDAVVTSWDPTTGAPDTEVADGRAYVLARDGGRLDVAGSSVSRLGYDAYERYGVSWRTVGTEGSIERSTFSGNFYGAYMHSVEPMTITDSVIEDSISYGLDPHSNSRDFTIVGNTFRNNGKHGLILAEDCAGAEVRDNESYGNREHGIVVFAGSDDAVITGNRVRENGGSGISLNGSARVIVRDNDVWANTTGVVVQDEATEATIEGNRLSSNRQDGLLVSSEQSTATVVANRIDHNGRAGVWVNGGQATVGPANRIAKNESGVRLVDETPSVRVFDNVLSGNYKDGFSLVVGDGLDLTGNRIEENEVAFSVRTGGLAAPFLDANTLSANELGPERVREAEPEAVPVP